MARINIEESLWKDFRFQDLLIKVGNRHMAKGMLLELWALAQEYWFPEKKLIPSEKIKELGLQPIVDAGLAELREGGFFAVGSEKAFDWLFQKQESGRKGGEASAKRKSAGAKRVQAPAQRNQPSLLSSLSSSLSSPSSVSDSFFSKGEDANAPLPAEGVRNPSGLFISSYVSAYQKRYGAEARPSLDGKVQGQIKRFLGETPIERACELVRTYCEMNDAWFITKAHDFGTFIENLSKVGLKLDTGTQVTRKEAAQAEHKQSVANVFANVLGGK